MADSALSGARTLVVGASSGIGRAFASAARRNGAVVAVAARRTHLLTELAREIGGTAHELDITDPAAISRAVEEVVGVLGGIDVLVCTSGVLPFARIEHINHSTWAEAFAVNTVGPTLLISAALPSLSQEAVVVLVTSDKHHRHRAGIAAYSASKAALDEILHAWRGEHPHVRLVRVAVGPTGGTELLRGADKDVLAELMDVWSRQGQLPGELANVSEIADALVTLVSSAIRNPRLLTEDIQLAPRAGHGSAVQTNPAGVQNNSH